VIRTAISLEKRADNETGLWGASMMSMRLAGLLMASLLVLWPESWAAPRPGTTHRVDRLEGVMPGLVIVKARAGTPLLAELSRGAVDNLAGEHVTGVEPLLPRSAALMRGPSDTLHSFLNRVYLLRIAANADPLHAAAKIAAHRDVEYAEPKYLHHLETSPNDPGLPNQSSPFSRLALFDAWSIATSGGALVIAVVDGGTFWPHEDLVGNLWINAPEDLNGNGQFDPGDADGIDQDANGFVDDVIGWNFASNSNDPRGLPATPQSYTHGTATASHFGAVTNNGIGMAGTAWNAALMPVCASAPSGDNLIAYGYEGILYAAMEGASVINCSWGRLGGYSAFEQDVIGTVSAMGSLVVAAVGNNSTDVDLHPHLPSCYKDVLSVGATKSDNDLKASFSNYGANVSVFAPGVNIWSALTSGLYGLAGSGTSYSSSLVAGVAGLVRSLHPSWTPAQVAAQIRSTADPVDGVNPTLSGKLGRGRVNAVRALTESHPALEIVDADFRSAGGNTIHLVGDTVLASFHIRNELMTGAGNTTFTLSADDPVLEILQGSTSVPSIGPGEELLLPPLTLRVTPTTLSRSVALRLAWTVQGEPSESRVYLINVFPTIPLWRFQESGTNLPLLSVKSVSRDVVWAAGGSQAGNSPVVLRSTDGGETWLPATGTLTDVTLYCIGAVDADRAWVGSGDGRIFASVDGGSTWNEQVYPDPQSAFINGVWFVNALDGFAQGDPQPGSTQFVVLATTDGGISWTHRSNAPVGGSEEYGWNNSFWWTDAHHGWFGTNRSRIWRTGDGGVSWSSAPDGATSSFGVAFIDTMTGFAAHGDGTVAKSTDGGQSWVNGSLGAGVGLVAAAAVHGQPRAWVSSTATPFQTTDAGGSWEGQATFPLSGDINHLSFASQDRGWAVTSGGEILRFDAGTSTSVNIPVGSRTPVSFRLDQNYPNPFNPSTTIGFVLPCDSRVRLVLSDLLGRTVRTVLDEDRMAGVHQVRFDARGLASGIYFYSLGARPLAGGPGFLQTRAMVLTR
jgi:subtilisin family serine protease/photosystem II stability/assembly factor-like uncharacterized protein